MSIEQITRDNKYYDTFNGIECDALTIEGSPTITITGSPTDKFEGIHLFTNDATVLTGGTVTITDNGDKSQKSGAISFGITSYEFKQTGGTLTVTAASAPTSFGIFSMHGVEITGGTLTAQSNGTHEAFAAGVNFKPPTPEYANNGALTLGDNMFFTYGANASDAEKHTAADFNDLYKAPGALPELPLYFHVEEPKEPEKPSDPETPATPAAPAAPRRPPSTPARCSLRRRSARGPTAWYSPGRRKTTWTAMLILCFTFRFFLKLMTLPWKGRQGGYGISAVALAPLLGELAQPQAVTERFPPRGAVADEVGD